MNPTTLLRVGIKRPRDVSNNETIAVAEARVVCNELQRRLGPLGFDLRSDGAAIGPWQPHATAAWPTDIDLELEAADLWRADQPALTALFGRTVAPAAAEVRERMLIHLGVIPLEPAPLDDERLSELSALRLRPTDLWLVVRNACELRLADPAVRGFSESVGSQACQLLDIEFDRLAGLIERSRAEVGAETSRPLERLVSERDDLSRRVAQLELDARRLAAEAEVAIAQLQAELGVMSERLERSELNRALTSSPDIEP